MNEIKCASLMVGDWIMDEHGFPMQIEMVGENYCYANFEGNEGDPWEFDDKDYPCYGIPLTKDVLAKAGYKHPSNIDCEWEYAIEGYYNYFSLMVYDDGIYVNYDMYGEELPIHYLHELQHLMRCNGIAEKADNIKI